MDNLNHNRLLNEMAMQESIRGGPACYRPAHRAPNPMARHLAEMRQEREQASKPKSHRLLQLKLPGLGALNLRLPAWALLGKLSL